MGLLMILLMKVSVKIEADFMFK